MKKRVLANWKANLSQERARQWCDVFLGALQPRDDIEVVLAVPALFMMEIAERVRGVGGIALAAQGVSSYPQGSYTGALPAAWLRELVQYTLIGHRERRRYFHETVQDIARQGYESLAEELQPIVCADSDQVLPQAAAFAREELDKLIWAYTPETTVSLQMARDAQDISATAMEMAKKVEGRPVLYGGGVTPENGRQIIQISGISGVMLGQGCLDAAAFAAMVNQL